MHLLAPNVTSVYTIGESIFPKVLDLMNPHSESLYTMVVYAELIVYFNNLIFYSTFLFYYLLFLIIFLYNLLSS